MDGLCSNEVKRSNLDVNVAVDSVFDDKESKVNSNDAVGTSEIDELKKELDSNKEVDKSKFDVNNDNMLDSLDIAAGLDLGVIWMVRLASTSVECSKLDFNEGIVDSNV